HDRGAALRRRDRTRVRGDGGSRTSSCPGNRREDAVFQSCTKKGGARLVARINVSASGAVRRSWFGVRRSGSACVVRRSACVVLVRRASCGVRPSWFGVRSGRTTTGERRT